MSENSEFIKEHRCINCGGTLAFVPEQGKLVCTYCGAAYDVPQDVDANVAANSAANYAAGQINQGYMTLGMTNQGYVNPGTLNQGNMNPSMMNQGYVNSGAANQGYVNPGTMNQGYVDPGMTNQGYTDANSVNMGYTALNPGNMPQNMVPQNNMTAMQQPNMQQANMAQPNMQQPNMQQANMAQPNMQQPNMNQSNMGNQSNVTTNAANPETEIGGFDFMQFFDSAKIEGGENLPIYHCKSCGADVLAAGEEAALTCPYCSSNIVLTDKLSGNIRPNGIIPFKIAKKDLKQHLDNFYKNKKLLPKNFFSASHIEKVTGVYVPFWLFSGNIYGTCAYTGKNTSTTVSGDYEVTTTKIYDVVRDTSIGFSGIPIDASDKIEDKLMDSVLPYDMSELKPYQSGYLSGYTADRFDVPGKYLQTRAEQLMKETTNDIVKSSVSGQYTQITPKYKHLNAGQIDVKYVLLPIYMFKIKYENKKYQFAVNGQTGKVVGSLPISKGVSRAYFLLRFGIVAGAIMLASLISYLVGGAF